MRNVKVLWVFALGALGALCIVHCVGDDNATGDGGTDATADGMQPDGGGPSDSGGDGDVVSQPPLPDGSLAWFSHYGVNGYYGAFQDLAVNGANGTCVVGGQYQTDPSATNEVHIDGVTLFASDLADTLLINMNATTGKALSAVTNETGFLDASVVCVDPPADDEDYVMSVAVDSAGNAYIAGSSTSASITLGTSVNGPTSFVAKISGAGAYLWSHLFTVAGGPVNTGNDSGSLIHVAVSGSNVIVSFGWGGVLTYDSSQTLASGPGADIYVAALDQGTGNTTWHEAFGSSSGPDRVEQIATNASGNIYIVGGMAGTMTGLTGNGFPVGYVGDAGTTNGDAYVVELDPTGTPVMSLVYGDPNNLSGAYMRGVASSGGTLALVGYFAGTGPIDFGAGPVTSQGDDDGFVIAYDEATSTTKFVDILAGVATDGFDAVDVDPWGEVVAAGTYGRDSSSATLGTTLLPQPPTDTGGMVLAKWSATGTALWTHPFIPSAPDGGTLNVPSEEILVSVRVHTNSAGQVALIGNMSGGADFGSGYQSILSTLTPKYCLKAGNVCHCSGFEPPIDGFVGLWQP
jgi:hypothetical protein